MRSMGNYVAQRRDKLRTRIRAQQLDALLITHEPNVTYLTGFSGDSSYLLVGRAHAVLLSDGRYSEQIEQECEGLDCLIRRNTGESLELLVAKAAKQMKASAIGVEADSVTLSGFGRLQEALPKVSWKQCSSVVERLRERKDRSEIKEIRQAIDYAERAYQIVRAGFQTGETEKQVAAQLEAAIRRTGGQQSAFDIIVATGPRAALPHARPGGERIESGVPVLLDWGAKGRFYRSDLTRLLTTRRIQPKLAKIYDIVLKAQQRAIKAIGPGVVGKAVDAEARAEIEQAGFGRFFTHSIGHGVGLEIHERPMLRPQSEEPLEPGMVVTVEPGIYLKDWGGVRIEDMVLVTKDGHEVLTHLPKDLGSILVSE